MYYICAMDYALVVTSIALCAYFAYLLIRLIYAIIDYLNRH